MLMKLKKGVKIVVMTIQANRNMKSMRKDLVQGERSYRMLDRKMLNIVDKYIFYPEVLSKMAGKTCFGFKNYTDYTYVWQ